MKESGKNYLAEQYLWFEKTTRIWYTRLINEVITLEEKKKFDQTKYITEYRKKHKKQFNVDLNIDEYNELEKLLKKCNITKAQFLRNSIEELKKSLKK